jgi:hypothetical protein
MLVYPKQTKKRKKKIGGAEMVENLSCWYIKGWAVECLVLLP